VQVDMLAVLCNARAMQKEDQAIPLVFSVDITMKYSRNKNGQLSKT